MDDVVVALVNLARAVNDCSLLFISLHFVSLEVSKYSFDCG